MFVVSILSACAVGPDFVRPAPPDTDHYTRQSLPVSTVVANGQAQHFTSGTDIAADWWLLFKSEQLDAVVRQAIANNPTLEAAEASLRQSQDNLRAGYGVFFPQISAGANASRQRTAPVQLGSQASGTIFNLFTVSSIVSYAIDVFGSSRRRVEGLRAQADDQLYASKAAFLTLTGNVVNTTIARAGYAAQIHSTEQMIELEKQQLYTTEVQVDTGTVPYSNVLSIRSLTAANQGTLALLKQKMSHAEHLLGELEGVTPSRATLPDVELAELSLPLELPVSLASDLVRQRPDILSAEAQMHIASANIGVATAAMFPSFSLSGSYGAASSSLDNFPATSSKFWNIGPSATIPLFRGGSLWFGRQAAIDAYQESQAIYRQTVLSAFTQVADALKALEHDAEALQAFVDSQKAANEALNLLQANYRAGLVGYLDVLVANVQFQVATIAYLQAVAQRHQDTVALFVALGGGWWNKPLPSRQGKTP